MQFWCSWSLLRGLMRRSRKCVSRTSGTLHTRYWYCYVLYVIDQYRLSYFSVVVVLYMYRFHVIIVYFL